MKLDFEEDTLSEWIGMNEVCEELIVRRKVHEGWIVYRDIFDKKKETVLASTVIFIPDKKHSWNCYTRKELKKDFRLWLEEQVSRDDPIGDLAKDFIADGKKEDFGYDYLKKKKVHKAVIEAYVDAINEFDSL